MIKLFFAFSVLLALFFATFSQPSADADLKKIAFINGTVFDDEKTGIKKLVAAHQSVGRGSLDCLPSPCGEKVWELREKRFVEPVLNEIRQSLKQIEAQNNVIIIDVYELDKNNAILAYDGEFTITKQFIDHFNDKQKNPVAVLKLDLPSPQIAFLDTSLFKNEKAGKEMFIISKAIQAFATEKRIAFIFDSAEKLPAELEKYPAPDVTKEFISYYNQINP